MNDPRSGDLRLYRMRQHSLGEWTLRVDSLVEAVLIVDYAAGWGAAEPPRVQRFDEDGSGGYDWLQVPADELKAERLERG